MKSGKVVGRQGPREWISTSEVLSYQNNDGARLETWEWPAAMYLRNKRGNFTLVGTSHTQGQRSKVVVHKHKHKHKHTHTHKHKPKPKH